MKRMPMLCLLSQLALLAGCAGSPAFRPAYDQLAQLAPGGNLRVALVAGSPTQLLLDDGGERGVMADMGKRLAQDFGLAYQPRAYLLLTQVLEALREEEADITLTNATAARAEFVAFSQTVLSIELGFLVPSSSPLGAAGEIDQPGLIIAVVAGSTTQRSLPRQLQRASVLSVPSLREAGAQLQQGRVQAIATNKALLSDLSDTLPGTRLLAGNWGVEHLALAVPKGREAATQALNQWLARKETQAALREAVERAGVRGIVQQD